ncbi:MAG: DUF1631 family protein [Marinobacter sp.]|uniref:DUF1631 family protein n=1 Tax=Marinobacter sp. TaxID=50741 RepID=UPI003C471021
MSEQRQKKPAMQPREEVMEKLGDVLSGIRVPDLPYPAGKLAAETVSDWKPLLFSCWTEQRDERVIQLIRSVSLTWSVRQINSAYVADRIMDVFLKTSGLHPELARRIARLRFFLAWRMNETGAAAFTDELLDWLDGFREFRGWSDSGGRSARVLLEQLDSLVIAVSACFENGVSDPFDAFCREWQADSGKRDQLVSRLRQRLLETEQGAARQRWADQTARALVGRALTGRQLPPAIIHFIFELWMPLLKQVVWAGDLGAEDGRHGSKLLEWLVWIGDPSLSDKDRNRLYHVGEQIGDRLVDVWRRVQGEDLAGDALEGIEAVLVARLRGETPELVDALPGRDKFEWDTSWLQATRPAAEAMDEAVGQWFVEGEGAGEQRRYFFALLEETGEILWTNGSGVKLGLQPWAEFVAARERGILRPLPALTPFGRVLAETTGSLAVVQERQKALRQKAAEEARARAETLRRDKEAADAQRRAEEAQRIAELEKRKLQEREQREADEHAEQARLEQVQRQAAHKLVDGIKLGGWIVLAANEAAGDPVRLKLAVRINASNKLVFVDRLGLNRREFLVDGLVQEVLAGKVRVLGSSAEFDDTLSRVVGRIRVGRN